MDKFGIKATLYDLLAYVLPGAFFLCWVLWMYRPYGMDLDSLVAAKLVVILSLILVSYICGQFVSSLGAFFFEGPGAKGVMWIIRLPGKMFKCKKTETKTEEIIVKGLNFGDPSLNTRNLIALVQVKYPNVYDTAFVFLSIYGMSRNVLTVILTCIAVYLVNETGNYNWRVVGVSFFVACVFFYNYKRFRRYFNAQIRAGACLAAMDQSKS